MRRIIMIAAVAACLIASGRAMSFKEFLTTALKQSDAKRDTELLKAYDKWDQYGTMGEIMPKLTLSANVPTYIKTIDEIEGFGIEYENEYEYYAGVISLSQSLPSSTEIEASMTYAEYSKYRQYGEENADGYRRATGSITLKQYLWGTNHGYHNLKRWLNTKAERNINLKLYNSRMLREIYQRYINYITAKKRYELNKAQSERYRDIFQAAENSYKMGLSDVISYNRIKKRYRFLEAEYTFAEAEYKREKKTVEMFLNMEVKELDEEVTSIGLDFFQDKKPDLKEESLRIELDNAYRGYKSTKSYYEPKVYAFYEAEYSGAGQDEIDGMEKDSYSAGIAISVPLGNLSTLSSLKKEKISYLISRNSIEDKQESMEDDYRKLVEDLQSYFNKMRIYKEIIPSLRQNYKASISRFTIGAISLQELMDIEDEYISTELEFLNIILTYNLTALDASDYIGNTDEILEGLL